MSIEECGRSQILLLLLARARANAEVMYVVALSSTRSTELLKLVRYPASASLNVHRVEFILPAMS